MSNVKYFVRHLYMKNLIFPFLIVIFFFSKSNAQQSNRISLQFLGSSYNYWTLSYEKSIVEFKSSNFLVGAGFSFMGSKSDSYVYLTHEYKDAPVFFNNSLYLKYCISNKGKFQPHTSLGYVYSKLINKDEVGDSWQGISRLREYTLIRPSIFLNVGSSYYFNNRIGINLDVYLYKEIRDFDRFPGYPYLFFGVGGIYNF